MWTPWRLGYIVGERPEGCLFCLKSKEPREKDKENYILHRGRSGFIMLNSFPYTNGHLMVAPYAHLASPELLEPEVLHEFIDLTGLSVALLRQAIGPEGFNIGMNVADVAGAGVADHLHMHVVPRWKGDTNFMSVLADIRLIPEALNSTYERLAEALRQTLK
ncbi:MAG TPA: HIT domain-containing protein [Dehalococcoidia bacterium]|jgi:ATP adenylyltransferase|nr:HIT domain-containing protein [Dehalococcoidia bacterium]